MNRGLQKFIPRIIRFSIPYLIATVFTVTIFYQTGEIFWLNKTFHAQIIERQNLITGTAYSNIPRYYKYASAEKINPSILAIGSSRVLQFRAEFFKDSVSFYTAGGVIKRIEQARAFLESLPENVRPKVIILGLDQWWFNAEYDSAIAAKNDLVFNHYSWFDNWNGMEQWQKFYYDWWNGEINWNKLWQKNDSITWCGIQARMIHQGYRKDGSRTYGALLRDTVALQLRIMNSIDSINQNNGLLRWSTEISPVAVNELRLILRFCKKNKIQVTGFIPQVHSEILAELKKHPEHFPQFFKLINVLYPVFRDYGYHVYDFTELQSFGSNNDEMVDGLHGGEKSYLKLYLSLLRKEGYLNQYSDSVYLRKKLSQAKRDYNVFGNL